MNLPNLKCSFPLVLCFEDEERVDGSAGINVRAGSGAGGVLVLTAGVGFDLAGSGLDLGGSGLLWVGRDGSGSSPKSDASCTA